MAEPLAVNERWFTLRPSFFRTFLATAVFVWAAEAVVVLVVFGIDRTPAVMCYVLAAMGLLFALSVAAMHCVGFGRVDLGPDGLTPRGLMSARQGTVAWRDVVRLHRFAVAFSLCAVWQAGSYRRMVLMPRPLLLANGDEVAEAARAILGRPAAELPDVARELLAAYAR